MSPNTWLKEMVERVPWMSPIHYEILNFFEEHDIWISARGLSENIDYDSGYLSKECKTLVQVGLLQKRGSIYSLTDQGRAFVAGEIDAEDLDEPED